MMLASNVGHAQEELETAAAKSHAVEAIEIQIGDDIFIAELLLEKAPRTTAPCVAFIFCDDIRIESFVHCLSPSLTRSIRRFSNLDFGSQADPFLEATPMANIGVNAL